MKKFNALAAFLLSAAMLLSLCGCNSDIDLPIPSLPGKDTTPSTQATTPAAPTQGTAPATPSQETTLPPEEGELLTTTYWSLRYDPEIWVYDEEELYDSEYSSYLDLWIPDPADDEESLVWVEIDVTITDHHSFRSNLHYYGFDAYEYAVNGSYDTVAIGGVDFLADSDEDDATYFARLEGARADVTVEIYGDLSHEALTELLEGLTFTIEDIGNVDAPWPWDGEPYAVAPGTQTVGSFTLSSQQIPFSNCVTTFETFDHNLAAIGSQVYVSIDGVIYQCTYDGSTLTPVASLGTEDEYQYVDAAGGHFWFSDFMCPLIIWDSQQVVGYYEDMDYVTMHPGGAWGISWFSGSDARKITFGSNGMTLEDVSFPEVDTISQLCIDGYGNIYVCGYAADDSGHKVFIYDETCTLHTVLTDEEGESLGSVTFATKTANGYLALDGNMRWLLLYDVDGNYIGMARFSDLFGTDYPWACDACVLEDGSILVLMTDERPDESADELVLFRLTGF